VDRNSGTVDGHLDHIDQGADETSDARENGGLGYINGDLDYMDGDLHYLNLEVDDKSDAVGDVDADYTN
jgi:hypothetical protein